MNIEEKNIDLFNYISTKQLGEVFFKNDPKSNLNAIIAINSTKFGPALGGCRYIEYPSTFDAIYDSMKLARAMSMKAALVNLPFGGGKGVIINNNKSTDRKKLFESYGQFVQSLNGKYITAIDSGSTLADMDIVATQTSFVASTSAMQESPSPYTAYGVYLGIKAAIKHKFNLDSVKDLRVAIQGVGEVGYVLCKILSEKGAKLTISDLNQKGVDKCRHEFENITVVNPDQIYSVDCDIFSPCALGDIINDETINQLKAKIIAGSANNQLEKDIHGQQLYDHDILYAPDFAINAGGLILATNKYANKPSSNIDTQMQHIYNTLMEIFSTQKETNKPTSIIANELALSRLES